MVFPMYVPSHSFGEFVAKISFMVLSCLAVVLVSLAVQRVIRVFRPDRVRHAVGPGPGHDPEDPYAAFVSDGHWFMVEAWPARAPGWLFRPLLTQSLIGVVIGVPVLALLMRLDQRWKVCVYRSPRARELARLVHVEFFADDAAAEKRQAEFLESWDGRPFLGRPPLTRGDVSTIRREP